MESDTMVKPRPCLPALSADHHCLQTRPVLGISICRPDNLPKRGNDSTCLCAEGQKAKMGGHGGDAGVTDAVRSQRTEARMGCRVLRVSWLGIGMGPFFL